MSCDHGFVDPADCRYCPLEAQSAEHDAMLRMLAALERIADAVEAIAFPDPERPA